MTIINSISILTFFAVSSGCMYVYYYLEERYRRLTVTRKIFGSRKKAKSFEKQRQTDRPWRAISYSLGRVVTPKKEEERSAIRKQLNYAGYRAENDVIVFFGAKAALGLTLAVLYLIPILLTGHAGARSLAFAFLLLGIGYYLPGLWLKYRIAWRRKRIFHELPDTLDLLLICMEAGLSFDMALYRVSRELAVIAPILSNEFGQYFLEIKSGLPRKEVMRNLADRNGVNNLTSVVNVLLQSSKFGTDIVEALKVYITSMRTERRQMAEEKGAKIATKLTFPLIAFILPALLIIVLGPALINLFNKLH